jgi:hypothetical protein
MTVKAERERNIAVPLLVSAGPYNASSDAVFQSAAGGEVSIRALLVRGSRSGRQAVRRQGSAAAGSRAHPDRICLDGNQLA